MKKLRKIAALLVAAALVFGTAACSSDDDDDDTPTSNYKSETGGGSGTENGSGSGSGTESGSGSESGSESGSGSETGGGSEEKTQPTLLSIAVKTNPANTTYVVNDDLDLTGLVITLTYSDDTKEDVSYSPATASSFTTSGFDKTKTGSQTVTVTYNEKSTTFDVTVNEGTYNYTGTGSYIKIAEYSEIKKYEKVTVTVNGPYIWVVENWLGLGNGEGSDTSLWVANVVFVEGTTGNSTQYTATADASKFPNGLYMRANEGFKCNVSWEGSGTAPNGDVSIGIE